MRHIAKKLSASEQQESSESILGAVPPANNVGRPPLSHVALLFLRLGFTAFGGPAAHIAMMEDEVVRRRHWLTRERFLDLLGAANLIPGPSSTEMAIYIGYTQAGWRGIVLGGACFILPAALITLALAWAYVRFGRLPQITGLLYGVKPVVIAIIVQAIWNLRRAAIKNRIQLAVGILALVAAAVTGRTLSVLIGAGLLMCLVLTIRAGRPLGTVVSGFLPAPFSLPKLFAVVPAAAIASVSLLSLFLVFFKVGAVVFGSGYVLLAFLKAYLVDQRHWLTNTQLLDAVAVGQVTPGPVFTTATFIGYVLAGLPGAGLATLGIFLPGFLLVAVSGPLIPWLRRSSYAGRFLDGVNVAALALISVVTWQLGRASIRDWPTLGLAVLSAVLLLRFRLNSVWLIAIGATAGLLLAKS